jgi:hypothetical protein
MDVTEIMDVINFKNIMNPLINHLIQLIQLEHQSILEETKQLERLKFHPNHH